MALTISLPSKTAALAMTALLLMTAGCSGLGPGGTGTPADGQASTATSDAPTTDTPATTSTATPTPTPTPDPDATDLRELDVQVTGSVNYSGGIRSDIDRADPQNENGYYEPVAFVAQENDTINVSVSSREGDPRVTLLAPNGTKLTIDDDGGYDDSALIEQKTLPTTGQYTVRVGASEDSDQATFSYLITVDRPPREGEVVDRGDDGRDWFTGDPQNWNQTEKYGEFANDFLGKSTAGNNVTDPEPNIRVNPDDNYIVLTYIDSPSVPGDERREVLADVVAANLVLYEEYTNDSVSKITDETWVPDRIYLRFVTPKDRELYQMNRLTKAAAKEGAEMDGVGAEPSINEFFASIVYGPANDAYNTDIENKGTNISVYPGVNRENEVQIPPSQRPGVENTTKQLNDDT